MSQNKRAEISSKKQLVLIILGYIFFGCFVFPLIKQSGGWMIEALNFFSFVFAYAFLSPYLANNVGAGQIKKFAAIVSAATLIGLLCRYLLEYGEISNIYNFTIVKVVGYTLLVTIYCSAQYIWRTKGKTDK